MSPRTRKRFAQHWLCSEAVLESIVAAAALRQCDRILEIGPGTGVLTRRLLAEVDAVVGVEIDRDLCRKLVKSLGQRDTFLLLQGDILSLDLANDLASFPKFQHPNKVVANIPYNITGPLLELLLGTIARPREPAYESIVLLVQKEIGDRLTAKPSSKAFSALSVRMQYLARCDLICDVPAKAFSPPPKVDSAVVRLSPRKSSVGTFHETSVQGSGGEQGSRGAGEQGRRGAEAQGGRGVEEAGEGRGAMLAPGIGETLETGLPEARDPRHLDRLVKLGFANRRKMLRNNLKGVVESDRLTQLLEQLEIDPNARAEQLSVEKWIALSNQLTEQ